MSVGFAVLKSVIINEIPFSTLMEHGIDDTFLEGSEVSAYHFIKNFKYKHGKYPEIRTIEAEIGQKGAFDNISPEPVEYYAVNLRERKKFWICSKTVEEVTENLHNNNIDVTVQKLRDCITKLNSTEEGYALKDLEDIQREVIDNHNQVQLTPGITGIPFGFPSLDELTFGQQPGDFNVTVGVTGACKSYICLQTALKAYEKGYNVMFISPEMPEMQVGRRVLALQTSLQDKGFRKGTLSYYEIKKALEIINGPIIVDGQEVDNWFKILPSGLYSDVNSIISISDEYQPDLLCVDGFYLLNNHKVKSSSPGKEDESVIFSLKNFAIHSQTPIFATTQYNRSKPGKIEGARGSMSVEQIASNFLSLDFKNPEDRETVKPVQYRILSTKKTRDGDSMSLELKLNFKRMEIKENKVISGKEGLRQQEPEFIDNEFITEV